MRFSIKQILSIGKSITNPRQAIDKMLSKLPPDIANMLRIALQRNADPFQVLQESVQKGYINIENFQEAKDLYKMAYRLGIRKFNVSDEQFNQIERTIRNSSSNNQINRGFKRL